MPTYQYACTDDACGRRFERVQSFTDAAISECPDCDGRVRKVYGSIGVVFKGSGFYRNDSRESERAAVKAGAGSTEGTSDKAGGDKAAAAGSGDKATPTGDAGSSGSSGGGGSAASSNGGSGGSSGSGSTTGGSGSGSSNGGSAPKTAASSNGAPPRGSSSSGSKSSASAGRSGSPTSR